MTEQNTRTIEQRIHINIPVVGSGKCNVLNHHNRLSDFSGCTQESEICFDTDDI